MAKSKRKSGKAARAAASAVIKKRGSSPETSDTDLEAVDSNEVRWEPLVIKEHYEGTDRQMTPSQQLLGGEEGDFDEDTVSQFSFGAR